ncbi:MAG: dTDP-4-dehydrorhamnose reductase [Desulfobulbaceae bacterium]|nr:dTDP-4-dehydrorhamnose reductase [Desulfobulbaceae bacterium]
MRILITGSGGQLGRDCAERFSRNHQVVACNSAAFDITDPERAKAVFAKHAPDVLVNCAAYTAVDRCEQDQSHCRAVNSTGPAVLARQCEKTGCRLIHISTDYVFDGKKKIPNPYTEYDLTCPLSVYGMSKLAGEQAIAEELENHLIIRTAWLYGMGGANFLKTMLRLAVNNPGRSMNVVDDQMGSLTWSNRLAEQIEQLLDDALTGIVHATAEGFSSWYDGAVFFLQAMGVEADIVPCSTSEYPTPAHRPANSILENRRLKQAGLNRMVPWRQDVETFALKNRKALLRACK